MTTEIPTRETVKDLSKRMNGFEKDLNEFETDLEECKDVRSDMKVLDERTKVLLNQSTQNKNAIYGNNGTKGILTRLSDLETTVSDVKKIGYALLVGVMGVVIELLINLILTHGTALAK